MVLRRFLSVYCNKCYTMLEYGLFISMIKGMFNLSIDPVHETAIFLFSR